MDTSYLSHREAFDADKETEIHEGLLDILLRDHTSGKNILWCTDTYALNHGQDYAFDKEIRKELIKGDFGQVIKPRVVKSMETKKNRTKDKAEVFTPSWVCNMQNNLIDEAWFGRKGVFNTETEDHGWITNTDKIAFPEGKSWTDYVRDTRMEITCGEAPYLASRYDTVTGESIPVGKRIGLLDRKLRVVSENTETKEDWIRFAKEAYENTYGYEWQGDNLFLARKTLLVSFTEYYENKFNEDPDIKCLLDIADVISWNLWQMDGLKFVIPCSCENVYEESYDLFDPGRRKVECNACRKKKMKGHIGKKCIIKDWKENKEVVFESLIQNNDL